ncbi:cation diffusion facilitator family transporter [Sinisalibacter aestuarii]|uniref:Cation efflux system protein n=1 Tax=Sinisalibacter aestuarii TaxID=2949426 RepID=A0ABQ5LVY2_9RHOB|nr:cation diffusion facilitator family transporter [Sinisalibacter aestuarii]GKY88252.1 cation efflux system protein [Sinisalibacter aestuarii]
MPHDHHHDHGHGHHHHHVSPEAGDRAVGAAVGVNLALTVAEIVGGLLSGSVALIADGIHNLSDAASLAIAWAARKIARRPTDATMTFGYKRAELVAALINYTTLIVIGLWLIWEAVDRFLHPAEIVGGLVIAVAVLALAVDLVTALLTWRLSKESLNIRAAFLHNLADALGSVAVIAVGLVVLLFGWRFADPVVTLGIALYILWMALTEIRAVIRILMLGSPPEIDPKAVLAAMETVDGVTGVHHLHLWQISEHVTSLEAHVVTDADDLAGLRGVKAALRAMLAERFDISHVTLDTETPADDCADARHAIGAA